MREFAFEMRLCAHRERAIEGIVARQLGVGIRARRVIDVVEVTPGPAFDERAAITAETIPPAAIEADVGPGRARPVDQVFDLPAERAEAVAERATTVGFFERERRRGRTFVRQAVAYPDWVGTVRGIENKPDLGAPGDLALQVRKDVALGALDEVVVATASHVTGAHLNRLPDPVGVWRFDPENGERTVVREPEPLDDGAGIEVLEQTPARVDVRPATAAETARVRRRVAERAYGKGWRPAFPGCDRVVAETIASASLPDCPWKGRVVDAARDCGDCCGGFRPADPPAVDPDAERAAASAWEAEPTGRARRQAGIEWFS